MRLKSLSPNDLVMDIPDRIDVGSRTFPLIVRFQKRGRHVRLRLDHRNQVVVSVPHNYSNRDVLSLIEQHYSWLEQQVARTPENYSIGDWLRVNPFLSADGERFSVRLERVDDLRANYRVEGKRARIVLSVPETTKDFGCTLLKLVKVFAKDSLACRLHYHANRLNLKFERCTVRDQSSRWGSCSSRKCISLNWRLVLIKPELQEYVILHELTHLTEMNHSKRFWDLLDSYDPLRADHESALKEVGGAIMRVGR